MNFNQIWELYQSGHDNTFISQIGLAVEDQYESLPSVVRNVTGRPKTLSTFDLISLNQDIMLCTELFQMCRSDIYQLWSKYRGILSAYAVVLLGSLEEGLRNLSAADFIRIITYLAGANYKDPAAVPLKLAKRIETFFEDIINSTFSSVFSAAASILCNVRPLSDRRNFPLLRIIPGDELNYIMKKVLK